jgi:DNA-binding NtrC family response regulator
MKILVIDDLLQEKVHNAFKKEGHTMMYILEPQLVESYIIDFEPDLLLIRSDSNSCKSLNLIMDIKYMFPRLPIVLYSTENDESLNELKATVKNIMYDLNIPTLPLIIDNQFHHGKSLVR